MVTDLVCEYVCLCEVAGRAQALFHDAVKARIDIEFLIRRAIERAHGGGCIAAAARRDTIGKHDESRMPVGTRSAAVGRQCSAGEERCPHVFSRPEHGAREITRRAVRLRRLADAGRAWPRRRPLAATGQRSENLLLESCRHQHERDEHHEPRDQSALYSEEPHESGHRLERNAGAPSAAASAIFKIAGPALTFGAHCRFALEFTVSADL